MKRLAQALAALHGCEKELIQAWAEMAGRHNADFEIARGGKLFSRWSTEDLSLLDQIRSQFPPAADDQGSVTRSGPFCVAPNKGADLLEDIQVMLTLVCCAKAATTALQQAAAVLRHHPLRDCLKRCSTRLDRQKAWLQTHLKNAAPQALIVD